MTCVAIDPGTERSALLIWHECRIVEALFESNDAIRLYLKDSPNTWPLVIERVESYGMAVGKETFETVYWSGIFAEAHGLANTHRIGRKDIKLFHCRSVRATDANIRMSILDRFGGKEKAIGTKKAPGLLYGISGHLWAALALAIAWSETQRMSEEVNG